MCDTSFANDMFKLIINNTLLCKPSAAAPKQTSTSPEASICEHTQLLMVDRIQVFILKNNNPVLYTHMLLLLYLLYLCESIDE